MGSTDPRFGMIIASIESNRRIHAMRFEPRVYNTINSTSALLISRNRAQIENFCTNQTAAVICATSWGMFQIMGFDLYGICRIQSDIIAYCNNESAQHYAFQTFCGRHILTLDDLDNRSKVEDFAAFYNGEAGRITYADKIMAEYHREYPKGH